MQVCSLWSFVLVFGGAGSAVIAAEMVMTVAVGTGLRLPHQAGGPVRSDNLRAIPRDP